MSFHKQTIRDIEVKGKTVLLRADYNVPLKDGKITDDYRIQQSLPTIKALLKAGAKLIICSHLGRPEGRVIASMSLFPVAKRLQELLGQDVEFVANCIGERAEKAAKALKPGQVLLLENVRFHAGEEANDPKFAKQLASLADVFVQDAFGVVHHAAVSISELPKYLPSVAGLLLEKEVDTITGVMENPQRPLVAIVGGVKIADKLEVLRRFIAIADVVAVGGAMANTFLVAQGLKVGASIYDKQGVALAKEIMELAEKKAAKQPFGFILPHDAVVAKKIDMAAPTRIVDFSGHVMSQIQHYPRRAPAHSGVIADDELILDIGPFTSSFIAGVIQLAGTVIWNGAAGVTETPSLHDPVGPTAHGTETIMEAIIGDFGHKPFSVVGGGDTVGYVESRGMVASFNHVSTGGGASMDLMSGRKLPGIEALQDSAGDTDKNSK